MNWSQRAKVIRLGYGILGTGCFLLGLYLSGILLSQQFARAQEAELAEGDTPVEKRVDDAEAPHAANSSDAKTPGAESPYEATPLEGSPPVFDTNADYRYEPVGKRDPFRPYRDSKIGIGLIRATTRPQEPLEKFDIKSLEVVAIVWGNDKPKALIQDPNKQVHSVAKGQRIGKNDGFIAEIREGEIVVVELFDLNGKIVKESVVIPIKK